jgi:NAD(P)-dependent dehydrogenase (short-subunit alcohol dehydrogenase family)
VSGGRALLGKTVVITGATSGIGEVAADRLAQYGARIVFVARDRARAAAMLKHLSAVAGHADHVAHYADLSRLDEMKRVGAEIAAAEPHVDVLINNAGAVFPRRHETADGLERSFALNHMSYFVLTALLLPRLKATARARIVSTASRAHKAAQLDLENLQLVRGYNVARAYGNSKLCNILFTRELARQLEGTGVTANCLHPGFVASGFLPGAMAGLGPLRQAVIGAAHLFARTPEQGAETIIYLASSAEVEGVSGKYFVDCKPAAPNKAAQNDADAKRLWEISEKISGIY